MSVRRRIASVALVGALAAACGGQAAGASPGPGTTAASPTTVLVVFAAASLDPALDRLATAYEAARPGVDLVASTDSSAALAVQIEQGAPADVFLSADTEHPRALADRGLAAAEPVPFARNGLAIVVPADNPAGLEDPADLARPGVRIVAAGDQVPITGYARRLLANLAGLPGYPAGFAEACAANVVSREDNVRAVLAKVELGEADAAIVYATDAASSAAVATIAVPGAAAVAATYAGVVIASSEHAVAAEAFLAWVAGPDGQGILGELGFLPVP